MDNSSRDGNAPNRDRRDPLAEGVSRRRMLRSSAAVGSTVAAAGCTGGEAGDRREPTVFAFNNGDRTVSLIDPEADELIETTFLGTTSSFPANQYGIEADGEYDALWLNVEGGVRAVDQRTLEEVAAVETGFGPNYPNLAPDGRHLVVAAGGTTTLDPDAEDPPTHRIVRVDADRGSDAFGTVTGAIETGYDGPCDVTMGPDGEYAYVAEINGEAIRVVRVDPFETAAVVDVGEPAGPGRVLPFMCTAPVDERLLLVENGEGELGPDPAVPRRGSESVWDLSDPAAPVEVARITREDGLPAAPITSEVAPDGSAAYLFTPGAGVTVLDLERRAVDRTLEVGGSAIAGTWGPRREKLYVPVQDADHVAVIEHDRRAVTTTIEAGASPTGATAGPFRPDPDRLDRLRASLASLGVAVGEREAAHRPGGHCHCG